MAHIIDFEKEMKKKFYKWVSQYLRTNNGDLSSFRAEELIAFLILENVFSIDELRNELNNSNISLHEDYFKKARLLVKSKKL